MIESQKITFQEAALTSNTNPLLFVMFIQGSTRLYESTKNYLIFHYISFLFSYLKVRENGMIRIGSQAKESQILFRLFFLQNSMATYSKVLKTCPLIQKHTATAQYTKCEA